MLTTSQLQSLKADILADGVLSAKPMTYNGAMDIANAYAQNASPDYFVWRSSVSVNEITQATSFDWTRVDNLSVGKARIWDWMTRLGTFNPSNANIRAGIDATWVGTSADLTVRAAVCAVCYRKANRLEKLFATGSGSSATPSIMSLEGTITVDEVQQAREMA